MFDHIKQHHQLIKSQIAGLYGDQIEKSKGEGSKGGKVIGHTKSGKPIYAKMQHQHYKGFTKEDHDDAGRIGAAHLHEQDLLHDIKKIHNDITNQLKDEKTTHRTIDQTQLGQKHFFDYDKNKAHYHSIVNAVIVGHQKGKNAEDIHGELT